MDNDRDDDLCCRHRFPWNRRYPWNSDHGCFRRTFRCRHGPQFGMVSPILAIDPIIDMPRTMINVTGSLTNALVVDKMMGNLNLDDYNDMSLNTLDSKANKESAEK